MFLRLTRWAKLIKKDVLTLWFACRDPATPVWIKALAGLVVAYALSPVDLIPDFIPILGLLDDAIIIPLGVMLLLRLLPAQVKVRALASAERQRAKGKKITSRIGMMIVLLIWAGIAVWLYQHYFA